MKKNVGKRSTKIRRKRRRRRRRRKKKNKRRMWEIGLRSLEGRRRGDMMNIIIRRRRMIIMKVRKRNKIVN